jgi:hypothetical protein
MKRAEVLVSTTIRLREPLIETPISVANTPGQRPLACCRKGAVDWQSGDEHIALSHRFSTTAPASQETGVAERELLIARRTVGGLRWGLSLSGGVCA